MSAEIKPCPFCGCTSTHLAKGGWVTCPECETDGPINPMRDEAIAAWNAAPRPGDATLPPEPPEGFVRVRVAVAVSEDGRWQASGAYTYDDECALGEAAYEEGDAVTWLTADVRKPVSQVYEAVATVDGGEG